MINSINAINNQSQMTFKAKPGDRKAIHEFIDKTNDLAMEIINKDRPIAEKREKAIRKSLELLTVKHMLNIELNYLKIQTFVGLGKLLGKCDKVVDKIPFVKEARINARNKKLAKYEEYVHKAVKDGVMDADHAGELLTKANPKTQKV